MNRPIATPSAPAAIGPYSQAIESDGIVFASGQLGIDPTTGQLPATTELQVEQALRNVEAILAAAGLTTADVVKTTVYLADMSDFAAVNTIYERHFTAPYPARSAVAVRALPKGALVEVEVTARRSRQ